MEKTRGRCPTITYQGITYISGNDPIFTHQYSQAWYDFRNKRDAYTNYFDNSILATKAHKLFCLSLRSEFPDYSEDLWGISASDYQKGYTAWGGPPRKGPIDGSIVPCAPRVALGYCFLRDAGFLRCNGHFSTGNNTALRVEGKTSERSCVLLRTRLSSDVAPHPLVNRLSS